MSAAPAQKANLAKKIPLRTTKKLSQTKAIKTSLNKSRTTKKSANQVQKCVGRLKILAEENRFRIIHEIMGTPKSVNEINLILKIEQSLLSHHLKILKESGLITSERIGRQIVYQTSASITFGKSDQEIDLGCCKLNF
jgi:DNA-binding transcriptional ArsR family regulator